VAGHLFIVRSDLTRLACDAWLVPTDAWLTVEAPWRDSLPAGMSSPDALRSRTPEDFGHGRHTFALDLNGGDPIPFITNVGGVSREDLPAHLVEFLDAAESVVDSSRVPGREVPLFAFPLVGTGHGGWDQEKGELTQTVVSAAAAWVATHRADAVLVSWTPQALAAAQSARRRLSLKQSLPTPVSERAAWFGRRASLGKLVLFLGAGIGVPAGLPLWHDLVRKLGGDAGIVGHELDRLMKLDALDAARIIEARLGNDPEQLGHAIAKHVGEAFRFGLGHALLASLRVTEAVTTNYDTLFERASAAAGRQLAVLPYDIPKEDGWLLKLHGCVERQLRDIVLTRGDYLRYADRRAALAGIVQALLITRDMLFVGFSLTDENFFRIADEVRKAIRGSEPPIDRSFGTALLVEDDVLLKELWAGDVDCIALAPNAVEGARALEIFLDEMLAHAATGAEHLLDPSFVGALDNGEIALAGALEEFVRGLPEHAQSAPAWAVVADALQRLGWSPAPSEVNL
jgi:hypothetical protein